MKVNVKHILAGIANSIWVKEQVEEIASYRYSICKSCPMNSKNAPGTLRPDEHCLECGCNLHLKTRSLDSVCPQGKWEALASEEDADKIKEAIKSGKNAG